MSNNIRKLYSDGLWGSDDDILRHDHVCQKLQLFLNRVDDRDDLNYHLKDALVGDVLFSVDAKALIDNNATGISTTNREVYQNLLKNPMHPQRFEIYKLLLSWNQNKNNTVKLRFEHVIPTDVYLEHIVDAIAGPGSFRQYKNAKFKPVKSFSQTDIENGFSYQQFLDLRQYVCVCIVTDNQNRRLNKFKNNMPPGWKWGDDRFSRYNNVHPNVKV